MATMMYPMSTTLAKTAAKPPAYDECPRLVLRVSRSVQGFRSLGQFGLTLEDGVDGEEVTANGDDDHGKGECYELDDGGSEEG